MSTDSPEFWNEIWADIEDCGSGSDEILVDQVEHLTPGRALEIGCGTGSNAVWLAKQGWQVTAVDYSGVAIKKGKRRAAERGVNVEFVVADVSTYQPQGHYDLITCFYIQLFPQQRANAAGSTRLRRTPVCRGVSPRGRLRWACHHVGPTVCRAYPSRSGLPWEQRQHTVKSGFLLLRSAPARPRPPYSCGLCQTNRPSGPGPRPSCERRKNRPRSGPAIPECRRRGCRRR